MFLNSLYSKFQDAGEDVAKMHDDFGSCSAELCFTRRHINKCMLTQKTYPRDCELVKNSYVEFVEQMFEHFHHGSFAVHEDNKHLIPLFKKWYLLLDMKAVCLHLDISEGDVVPKVKVLRSNGYIQDAWLKPKVSVKFIESFMRITPCVFVKFLVDGTGTIYQLSKTFINNHVSLSSASDSFKMENFKGDVVEMVSNQFRLTQEYKDYLRSFCGDEVVDEDFLKNIDFMERFLNRNWASKYVPIDEFMRINPDFKMKMIVEEFQIEEESEQATHKMAGILNYFQEHMLESALMNTLTTNGRKFYELIDIVGVNVE